MERLLLILSVLFLSTILSAQGENPVANINTLYPESRPLLSPDGETLYFVRYHHPRNMGIENKADVWVSQRMPAGQWGRPLNAGSPLNSIEADAIVSVGPTGIWLLRYHQEDGRAPEIIYRNGRGWQSGGPLYVKGIENWAAVQSCFLGLQGQVLLLAINDPTDLYYSFLEEQGSWSKPQRFPQSVNSQGVEMNPVLAADGRTLYFASNRSGGQGGFDLWMSRRVGDWSQWSSPQNLGPMINTNGADTVFTISAAGDKIITSRLDPSGNGNSNLVELVLPEAFHPTPITLVTGSCTTETGQPLPPSQLVYQTGEANGVAQRIQVPQEGNYTLVIPKDQDFHLSAESKGYFAESLYLTGNGISPEGLDQDPNNTLASASLSAAYFQRDAEIDGLQIALDQGDQQLLELQAQRQAYLDELQSERRRQGWTFKREEWTDPEWEALQARYQTALDAQQDTTPANPQWQARGITEEERQRRQDNLAELEEMKRRFRAYHEQEEAEQQTEAAEREAQDYLWAEEASMDELYDSSNDELTSELIPEVVSTLSQDWVVKTADPTGLQSRQITAQNLQAEIQASFRQPAPKNPEASSLPAWQEELKSDIKGQISPVVRERMTSDLKNDIRSALQVQSTIESVEGQKEAQETELRQKVLLQIREEEKQGISARAIPPANTPVGAVVAESDFQQLETELRLIPLEVGKIIRLENIFFAANQAQPTPPSLPELNRIHQLLVDNPGLKVEFRGHTHTDLSHAMAMDLSAQRAKAVADFLSDQGIDRSRIAYRAYGKIAPLVNGDDRQAKRKNQRIEMLILELGY